MSKILSNKKFANSLLANKPKFETCHNDKKYEQENYYVPLALRHGDSFLCAAN